MIGIKYSLQVYEFTNDQGSYTTDPVIFNSLQEAWIYLERLYYLYFKYIPERDLKYFILNKYVHIDAYGVKIVADDNTLTKYTITPLYYVDE